MIDVISPGRSDVFWCSERCDSCTLRFKCLTDSIIDGSLSDWDNRLEVDWNSVRGLDLGDEIC